MGKKQAGACASWTYHVWFRKYGPKDKKGDYPVLIEIDKGTYDVPDSEETEEYLRRTVGNPPSGLTMDFSLV